MRPRSKEVALEEIEVVLVSVFRLCEPSGDDGSTVGIRKKKRDPSKKWIEAADSERQTSEAAG